VVEGNGEEKAQHTSRCEGRTIPVAKTADPVFESMKVKPLSDALLYGIVDLGYVASSAAARVAERMICGGIDILQLRAKDSNEAEIVSCARLIASVAQTADVPFIINDFPDLVSRCRAHGAHVGQDDLSVAEARCHAKTDGMAKGPPIIIGKSTHSLEQAVAAEKEGADYIGFGPLFSTPTKPGRAAIGLADIFAVHNTVELPIFCIGGIKRENLEEVMDAGARRVVIVSGILQAADITAYCRDVKSRLIEIAHCASPGGD